MKTRGSISVYPSSLLRDIFAPLNSQSNIYTNRLNEESVLIHIVLLESQAQNCFVSIIFMPIAIRILIVKHILS